MTTLADWLRSKDISDAEFGRRIGCDRGSVGRYTRGERYPDPPTLIRIRQETDGDVSADDMLATWEQANPGKAPLVEPPAQPAAPAASAAE
jgi:transcriptional regulator with XRE-family HTH domain